MRLIEYIFVKFVKKKSKKLNFFEFSVTQKRFLVSRITVSVISKSSGTDEFSQ